MTDEFKRGLIMGLAMQPLYVTTQSGEEEKSDAEVFGIAPAFIGMTSDKIIFGEVQ